MLELVALILLLAAMTNSDKPQKPLKPNKPTLPANPEIKLAQKLELIKINAPNLSEDQPEITEDNAEPEINIEQQQNLEQIEVVQERDQPISTVTDLMQYRAIGVVYGTYIPQEELTKGILVTQDGIEIDAVLLGKIIPVAKKRLDLSKQHCWVVYPRTRTKSGILHLQINGVWAPEELGKPDQAEDPGVNDGYFSIRGEVVAQSFEQNTVTIKIQRLDQNKTLDRNQAKFKLQLNGIIPSRSVGYFWEINARRVENCLEIVDGRSIAQVANRSRSQKISKEVIFKPKPVKSGDSVRNIPKPQRRDQTKDITRDLPKPERPLLKKEPAPEN